MSFGNPGWLPAGLVACAVLIWLWHRRDVRQHAALARFVSTHLRAELTRSISTAKRRLQRTLFLAALALLFVALADPLLGYRWEQISRRGNEIVFAIDTSRSMSTPDMKPDRLTRAKLAIDDFAKQLDGDAVGIVAFAGTAFLVCPITLDYGAFHESLNALDTHTIPRGGTNISSAIHEAQAALRRRAGSDKILILVTDGEDLEGSALVAAQTAAKEDGMKIYTVGVGSAAGDLIPIPPDQGGGFVQDDSGAFVKSRLDEAALKAMASATGGLYVPLGTQGEGLATLFKSILGPLAKHDLASRQQKIYTRRYQWPLAASLGALLASLLIGSRRRRRVGVSERATSGISGVVGLTLLIVQAHPTRAAGAAPAQHEAGKPVAEFNAGTAAYRAGDFAQAAQAFQQSISHDPSSDAKRLADQEDAYYNLGNTLYRTGEKTAQSSVPDTIEKWTQAVKAYETALQLRADDADSKYNRDLVKRKIDALKQQQNQQQQNQQNPNQNKGQGQQPPGQPPPPPQNPGDSKGDRPQPKDPSGAPPDQQADAAARAADNQHPPGQMSREEARELLDSVKADERHPPGAPLARRESDDDTPEKPFKNW